MTGRGTRTPLGTPPLSGTPAQGVGAPFPERNRTGTWSFALRILVSLAVFQGLFFLLPLASAASRLIGIALTLTTVLAARVLHDSPSTRSQAVNALAALIVANFTWHLVDVAPVFPFRLWQVAIVLGYAAALVSGIATLAQAGFRNAFLVCGGVAVLLLFGEGLTGSSDDFSPTVGKVEWAGPTIKDPKLGVRFAPNSVAKTMYPDNPRGYFDEPDAMQRRWSLVAQEGSQANLLFPKGTPGVLRVAIGKAPGKVGWHIALTQSPLRVIADERYEVRFRARSDSVRTIFVAVGLAHAPWTGLGLYREVRVDTAWRDYSQTFRATASERNARLYFDFGAELPSVELASIEMRAISTNQPVEAEAKRELSVSYHINAQGCRGPDYPARAAAGTWRVLSLGNGAAFGVGVRDGDTYSARLEALLNESAGTHGPQQHYDVINCGMRGTSTQQAVQLFDALGAAYSPDVVLLAVNPMDDRLSTNEAPPPPELTVGKLERFFHVWGIAKSIGKPKSPPVDYRSAVADIKQLDAAVRSRGARLSVVLFQHRTGPDWTRLDSTLSSGLRDANIPILRLDRQLLPFGEQKLLVHEVYDHHPNDLAHRIAAESLRKFLTDQGMLGDARPATTPVPDTARGRRSNL